MTLLSFGLSRWLPALPLTDNLTSAMLYAEILPNRLAMRCIPEVGIHHTRGSVVFISKQRPLRLALMLLLLSLTAVSVQGQDNLAAQASALMQAGKFHDAELLWRQLEAQEPKNSSVHNSLGFALAQQGELDLAAVEYRRSLTSDPHQPDVAFALGVTEFKQGHFSEAIPRLSWLAKGEAGRSSQHFLLGMSYFGLRDYTKRFRICRRHFRTIRQSGTAQRPCAELLMEPSVRLCFDGVQEHPRC